ncbi:MAG: glycerol-3-phosphate 1-O-acyltransferase PlsY [Actinomycetota bacterium]|nr:glycerol-3-phosphate 1-O-acyltransferase PlsY [Actinomycetota bacterium]
MTVNLLYKILLVIFAYLFGSFPTAFVIYKANKGEDIRNYGSGNVGGTNVLRSAGPGLGVLTIVIDILKGFIPVLFIYLFFRESHILYVVTTFSVLIGHVFPVFLRFKGGKGVSTTGGLIIASCVFPFSSTNIILRLLPAVIIVSTVIVIFFLTRMMSIGSISAAIINPVVFYICGYDNYIVIAAAVWSLIVLIAHTGNIKRLLKGEEKKILRKKKEE